MEELQLGSESETVARAVFRSTHSPLPFQGEASVGSSQRATLLTPQQDVVKHAAREISNHKQSTGHASEAFYAPHKHQESIHVSPFQGLTVIQ